MSLRLRIAATITGVVLVAVAALGVAVHLLVVLDRVHETRASADERMRTAMEIYERTGLLSFDARVDDADLPGEVADEVEADGSRATLVSGGGTRELWAAGRVGDEVLSTRTTFRPADAQVAAVDRALVLAGAVTVVLAAGVGLLVAGRLARRLRVAARTARSVAGGGDPGALRAAVGDRRDEVGDLADAVDAMAARLASRLRAEQRFTADVAHDLRTPVTGLATAAALLDDSRPAQLVRERATTLAGLVEDLLEVSRLDSGGEVADLDVLDVREAVLGSVRRGVATGEYDAADVVVRTGDEPVLVQTDPRRLERVLSNLVRNAVRHGAPPVEVVQSGCEVVVRDHGPGFPEPLLGDAPDGVRRLSASSRRTGGTGLGLVIATGQAAVIGARLSLDNPPDGGARARLVLPADR